jgi:hypothetical protein
MRLGRFGAWTRDRLNEKNRGESTAPGTAELIRRDFGAALVTVPRFFDTFLRARLGCAGMRRFIWMDRVVEEYGFKGLLPEGAGD